MRVIISGNKRGLPMVCYVGKGGFLTYLRDHAKEYKSEEEASADLAYFRNWKLGYTFAVEPARVVYLESASANGRTLGGPAHDATL